MRKVIISVVAIVLAGTYWVVAQNASSNQWTTPYGQQRYPAAPPSQASTGKIDNPAPSGAPGVVSATPLDTEAIPAPPPMTALDPVQIPIVPETPPAAPPTPSLVVAPPASPMAQVIQPSDPAPTPISPPTSPTPLRAAPPRNSVVPPPAPTPFQVRMPPDVAGPAVTVPPVAAPAPLPTPQAPLTDVPYAPITMPSQQAPAWPAAPVKPPVRSTSRPAVPIIGALPPVPGVPVDSGNGPGTGAPAPPGGGTIAQGPAVAQPNQPFPPVEGLPGRPPQPVPAFLAPPQATWTVDDPSAWNNGPPIFDNPPVEAPGRVLGPRIWFNAEYLFWFIKPQSAPVLVQAVTGVQPGDTTYSNSQVSNLFPGGPGNTNFIQGVRGTLGLWLTQSQTFGFETGYFWLGANGVNDTFFSSPTTVLGRPFINADNGQNALFQLSSVSGAGAMVQVRTDFHAEGGDANFLMNSFGLGPRLNVLAGFRYLEVNEAVAVSHLSSDPSTGYLSTGFDSFGTRNQFFGGQLGLRWNYERSRLFFSVTGKIAYGAINEEIRINGSTFTQYAGVSATVPGNVLAQPTNIGLYNHTTTTFIPEANATLGYRFAPWAVGFVGYNFLYVNNLVRPGNQINPYVSPENLPFATGTASNNQPSFNGFRQESLWLQGINLGMTFRY